MALPPDVRVIVISDTYPSSSFRPRCPGRIVTSLKSQLRLGDGRKWDEMKAPVKDRKVYHTSSLEEGWLESVIKVRMAADVNYIQVHHIA